MPTEGSLDAGIAEIARILGALPVVLPASGSCAPIEPSDLSFTRQGPQIATPDIRTERLQTFPDIAPPLKLPPAPPPATVVALLAPLSPDVSLPWSPERTPRRRWAWAIDALTLLALAAIVILRSPLASHPTVRPFAQAATSGLDRGWHSARDVAQRGIASTSAWARSVMR